MAEMFQQWLKGLWMVCEDCGLVRVLLVHLSHYVPKLLLKIILLALLCCEIILYEDLQAEA